MKFRYHRLRFAKFIAVLAMLPVLVRGGDVGKTAGEMPATGKALEDALSKLKLPGVMINLAEHCVDVDASVCLAEGALELIACTKDSKEHEAIVAVDAKAMHIHTALLLLGSKSGNPAMRKLLDGEKGRWIDVPPSGGEVDVFLVFKNSEGTMAEHPISDFIERCGEDSDAVGGNAADPKIRFPTHTFLFAGSHLVDGGSGPRRYLSDESGNVISLVTFGDEMLCLTDFHSQENGALMWEVDPTDLPPLDSRVILRLRPKLKPALQRPQAPILTPEKIENP